MIGILPQTLIPTLSACGLEASQCPLGAPAHNDDEDDDDFEAC